MVRNNLNRFDGRIKEVNSQARAVVWRVYRGVVGKDEVGNTVFSAPRLVVHLATIEDAALVYALWTDPRVMRNVGFPRGLPVTLEEVQNAILQGGNSVFDRLLIIRLKLTGEAIGQSMMKSPNEQKIAETDVKLVKACLLGSAFRY